MRTGARPSGIFAGERVVLVGKGFDQRAVFGEQFDTFVGGAAHLCRLTALGVDLRPAPARSAAVCRVPGRVPGRVPARVPASAAAAVLGQVDLRAVLPPLRLRRPTWISGYT